MEKDTTEVLVALLDELIQCWSCELTSLEIRNDIDKIRLMMLAEDLISRDKALPSSRTQQVYREVFLRDVFTPARESHHRTG